MEVTENETIRANLGYVRIDGSTAAHKRQPLVDRFQEDPDVRVAIFSIAATNSGLTVTAATEVRMALRFMRPTRK